MPGMAPRLRSFQACLDVVDQLCDQQHDGNFDTYGCTLHLVRRRENSYAPSYMAKVRDQDQLQAT